ncbi:hypothetical protein [Nannocystis bainbridge]|uniref:Cytochrome C n=1 Tax=Nannocystis bainbridge TaxID=2995303 RepID=A0ABT5EC76_9BACT|nr:hypothetical protein [Nannocystis bainbridge]MDC0723180.1 hypothetical protein [Nannocystis bainbridge]
MKKLAFLALAAAAVGGLSLTSLPSTAIAKGQCNGTTKPCPLQQWMRDNLGTPMASGDFVAVAKGVEKIQTFGGPAMKDWTKFAKKTVDDLKANKSDDVKADCKTCHDAYKVAYKNNTALRNRPIP